MRRRMIVTLVALMSIGAFAGRAAAQNPFITNGALVPDAGVPTVQDPQGNVKELGPKNGDPTKIPVINSAVPPMLEFTNPNAQVDLDAVYLQTRMAADGDQWLYFGWLRDSNNGSGFISIEFQQAAAPAACAYTTAGIDFVLPESAAETTLINNCNPWRNRQTNDFIILWDQQGNGLAFDDIKKRVYSCTGTTAPRTCVLGPIQSLGSVQAGISGDRFSGEMAINLTDEIFGAVNGCLSFANVLPGTVTGNSDTADYKDTVFATFPPITNCGVLKVTKRTVDADGNAFTDPRTPAPAFGYTVARSGGAAIRFDADAPTYPVDGPATQISIVRPNTNTPAGPALLAGATHTHLGLIVGGNYTLVETAPLPTPYELASIVCTDAAGAQTVTAGGTFAVSVPSGAFEATECVITNRFARTTPSLATTQSARVFLADAVNITNLTAGASNQATEATFTLYDGTCTTVLGSANATLNYSGTTASASMSIAQAILVNVPPGGATFRWRVSYPGDLFNDPVLTPCTLESTTVVITHNDSGS